MLLTFHSLDSHALISLRYLAGFVDAEGYLALARIPRSNRSTEYCVRLVVYNTNQEILEQIQRSWGGTLSDVGQRRPGWKPSWALIWTNAGAAEVLRNLAPYLLVKSEQAAVLLGYQDRLKSIRRSRWPDGSLRPLPRRELTRREALFRYVKKLNARDPLIRSRYVDRSLRVPSPDAPSAPYLAGFVDGEGSVMIVKSKAGDQGRLEYRGRVSLANTDARVLRAIREGFGGMLEEQPPLQSGWNPLHQLVWSEGMAEPLLRTLLPHLRIKQRQARVVLDFIAHKRGTRQEHAGRGFAPLPAETVARRDAYYRTVSGLNARGTG